MEEYDYIFTYTLGKDNIIADMLSRHPTISLDSSHIEEMNELSINDNVFPLSFDISAREQTKDQELQRKLRTSPDIFSRHEIFHGVYLVFRHYKIPSNHIGEQSCCLVPY